MERVTPKDEIEIYNAFCNEHSDKTEPLKWSLRAKYYEDLEEQGLLVRFPCKIGDTVFVIRANHIIKKDAVRYFTIDRNILIIITDYADNGMLGFDVFLTEEEAEKKLKELKEEK